MAQPSISEQIRRLEAELGVRLFQRVGRGLTPTEAGHTLRPHAERTLDAAEAARESVVAVRELRGGTATFGTWGTARYYPGVDFVAEFRRRHPSVRVRVVGQNSSEVVEAVRSGELEAGMIALPIDDRGLDVQPIMRDEIVYASTDPAHVRRPVTIEALARGAAHPGRRELRDRGPDAPPARRARAARRRLHPAADRRRGHRGRPRAGRARAGGHDRLARDPARDGQARVQAAGLGALRRAVLRHLRLHRARPTRRCRPPRASSSRWRASASPRWRRGCAPSRRAGARPANRAAAPRCSRAGGAAARRPPWGCTPWAMPSARTSAG